MRLIAIIALCLPLAGCAAQPDATITLTDTPDGCRVLMSVPAEHTTQITVAPGLSCSTLDNDMNTLVDAAARRGWRVVVRHE